MTYDEAELIDVNNEEGKFVNAIAKYFNFGKIYNNISVDSIWDCDISFDNASGFLLSVEDLRKFFENEEIRKKL